MAVHWVESMAVKKAEKLVATLAAMMVVKKVEKWAAEKADWLVDLMVDL